MLSRVGLGVSLSIELEIALSYLLILILASLKRMDKTLTKVHLLYMIIWSGSDSGAATLMEY